MGRGQGGGGGRGRIAGGGSTTVATERTPATQYVDPSIADDTLTAGLIGRSLTPEELSDISLYTSWHYEDLNAYLGGYTINGRAIKDIADLNPYQRRMIDNLPTALSKLPAYEGKSWRSVSFGSPEAAAAFAQQHVKGSGVKFDTFLSTTKDRSVFGNDRKGTGVDVFYTIKGKRGRHIEKYSAIPEEREVLFTRGSRFKVTNVSQRASGAWDVELEQ